MSVKVHRLFLHLWRWFYGKEKATGDTLHDDGKRRRIKRNAESCVKQSELSVKERWDLHQNRECLMPFVIPARNWMCYAISRFQQRLMLPL